MNVGLNGGVARKPRMAVSPWVDNIDNIFDNTEAVTRIRQSCGVCMIVEAALILDRSVGQVSILEVYKCDTTMRIRMYTVFK